MVIVNDLKPGSSFISNGNIYQVINTQLNKTAMRQMIVKVKVKNLRTGVINEMSFTGGDKVEQAVIDRKQMQYLYDDGTSLVFMDNETYDQIALGKDIVGDSLKFVKENENVKVASHAGNVFAIEPEINVVLEVTECEPGVKGNTATGATKPCTVETGATLNVPLFVNQGDKIIIDTRTGEYMSRA